MNKKPTVILLSGHAGCGKDFTANILKEQLEALDKKVLITHYADLLKYICKSFFNWNGEKDEYGRTLLQQVGTNTIRKQNRDYWVNFLSDFITMFPNEWDYILIPDTRFPNEIEVMKQNKYINTISMRIIRRNYNSPLTEEQQKHPSETALDTYMFDYFIQNNTKCEVEEQINGFIRNKLGIEIKPTAFIDLDCTVFNTIKAVTDLYNNDFGGSPGYNKISWDKVKSYDFTELTSNNLVTKGYLNTYFNQKRFFDIVEILPHATKVIDRLSKIYNIVFVSHGYDSNLKLKDIWVKAHFHYAEFIGIDLSKYNDKSCVDMSGKGNIFIDDVPNNLYTSNAETKICFGDYGWNDDYDNTKISGHFLNWEDAEMMLFNNLNYTK